MLAQEHSVQSIKTYWVDFTFFQETGIKLLSPPLLCVWFSQTLVRPASITHKRRFKVQYMMVVLLDDEWMIMNKYGIRTIGIVVFCTLVYALFWLVYSWLVFCGVFNLLTKEGSIMVKVWKTFHYEINNVPKKIRDWIAGMWMYLIHEWLIGFVIHKRSSIHIK